MVERFHEAPAGEGIVLMGRIDRIDRLDDGSLHVIDYKTGRVPDESDASQLLLYALILSRILDWPVSRASYVYLEDCVWDTHPIEDEDVDESRKKVVEVADQIQAETEYRESLGPLCRFCDFLEICTAGELSIQRT